MNTLRKNLEPGLINSENGLISKLSSNSITKMNKDRKLLLIDSIKRLLRRSAVSHLKKIVNKTHAADLSWIFPALPLESQRRLLSLIDDNETKGTLFTKLDEDTFLNLIQEINLDDIVQIFEELESDDVADLLGRMPEERSSAILKKMKEGSEEIEGLLRYGDDTAGGIMVPDFIALKEDVTAQEAIKLIQKDYKDVEMPFYLYAIDEYGKLVGVCSLRQLVVVAPDTPLKQFMTRDVFYVHVDMDQEEVAKIVARYDILAVPVIDHSHKLVGIVTVDDVIDILREEATEDILKMAGVGGEEYVETKSVYKSIKIRLPWLFASCVGGIFASLIIGGYMESLHKISYLAAFIPVIMGMGGNIGIQSSTIVVRGLAMGRISVRDIWKVVSKELAVGLLLGLVYGLLVGAVAQVQHAQMTLAITVGLSVVVSMLIASLTGSMIPMLLARLNVDPAVATGPFVTTAMDILSVTFYLQIATFLMDL